MTANTRLRHAVAVGVAAVLIAVAGVVLPVSSETGPAAVAATTTSSVSRLQGTDRYETAAAISAATFGPGVAVAYIASGVDYPDALSGAAIAARTGGPVLLVKPTALPNVVAKELTRLAPKRIVILGGEGAVSADVASALARYTKGGVVRYEGLDRYETAVAVTTAVFPKTAPVVFLASGVDFPDALSSAAAAGTLGGAVLLTRPNRLPEVVAAELKRLKPSRVVIAGGTGAVSAAVASAVRDATGRTPERAQGTDRYATAAAISALAFPDAPVAYLASGTDFPDALGGAVAAVSAGGPLLLTKPTSLPAATGTALSTLGARSVVVLGGTGAVSSDVATLVADFATTRDSAASGVLTAATQIKAGKCLSATTGTAKLCVTAKGAVEVRDGTSVVWTSRTSNAAPASLRLRAGGDLVLFATSGAMIWRTYTVGSGAVRLSVIGSGSSAGDVRLTTTAGAITWASMTGADSPTWALPFEAGEKWSAGGPHASSGANQTRYSLDFGVASSSKASRKVVAIAAGKVVKLTCGSGSYLAIDHGGGWQSSYYHLVNMQTKLVGTYVEAGTYLGDVGRALPCGGGATFDHVHVSIRYNLTTVPNNATAVSVEGMTFGGYTIRNTGSAFSGIYTNADGAIKLTASGGANCCLQAPVTEK